MLLQTHYDVCSIALFLHLSCLPPAATWERGRKHIKKYDKIEEEVILINNALIWKFRGNEHVGYAVLGGGTQPSFPEGQYFQGTLGHCVALFSMLPDMCLCKIQQML